MRRAKLGFAAVVSVVALLVVGACGGAAEPTAAPAPTVAVATATPVPRAPTATSAPGAATATPVPAPTATAAPRPTVAAPTGTLNVAIRGLATENFVPRLFQGAETGQLMNLVGDPFITLETTTRGLEGRWASEWSYSKIGTDNVWSFKLRPGILINEGWGQFTAEDVKFNFAEFLRPDAVGGSDRRPFIGSDINNFEMISPLEFRLHSPQFEPVASLAGPLPNPWITKAYFESAGDEGFSNHPVGTGSFVFKSRLKGSKYTVEAVPGHWRRTSNIQTVNLLLIPETVTRVAMLKTGQADMANLETRYKPELTGDVRPYSIPQQVNAFVTFGGMYYDLPDRNCATCPWVGSDEKARKVREALTVAIDRQTILSRVLMGEGTVSAAPFLWFPGPYSFVDQSWKVPAYDPARAKQLLVEAGYPNGFEAEVPFYTLGGLPEMPDIAEALSGYWEQIGIKVKRTPVEYSPVWLTRMRERRTAGMLYLLYFSHSPDQIVRVSGAFTAASSLPYMHEAKATELVQKYKEEPSAAKRDQVIKDLGVYYVTERLGIPLFSVNGLWGFGSRMVSWTNIAGVYYLHNVETVVIKR